MRRTLLPLLLALSPPAHAQDSSAVDPPIPTSSSPWLAVITAYALPPQKVEYLTDDQQWRSCVMHVAVDPSGTHTVTAGACPAPMQADAVLATEQWRFAPGPGVSAAGPTTLTLTYQLQYSAALGVTTLHAEVDPGPSGADLEGRPGLVLIHGPLIEADIATKLPKAARKAGVLGGSCQVSLRVGADGRASTTEVVGCDETLAADARARVDKSRWTPRTVDGQARAADAMVTLNYGTSSP
jgi:Gram-negative bacterial TonB protein C-terminal